MIFHFNAAKNFVAEHEERDFELIFQFRTAQNVVAYSTMKEILTLLFTCSWRHLKTWLDSNIKGIFTRFSTLRSLKKLVAEHYERNFDMNFLFMAPQILIAEHCERDFDMIFNVKAAQNFAAERHGIDFDRIFLIMAA